MSLRAVIAGFVFLTLRVPGMAQISMQRPGMTGVPQGRRLTTPKQSSRPATLTANEQKRLAAIIKHMKRKDRQRLAAALQRMTPQQRQELVLSVKKELAQDQAATNSKKGSR